MEPKANFIPLDLHFGFVAQGWLPAAGTEIRHQAMTLRINWNQNQLLSLFLKISCPNRSENSYFHSPWLLYFQVYRKFCEYCILKIPLKAKESFLLIVMHDMMFFKPFSEFETLRCNIMYTITFQCRWKPCSFKSSLALIAISDKMNSRWWCFKLFSEPAVFFKFCLDVENQLSFLFFKKKYSILPFPDTVGRKCENKVELLEWYKSRGTHHTLCSVCALALPRKSLKLDSWCLLTTAWEKTSC